MYIEPTGARYDRGGQQVVRRARFLILMQTHGEGGLRGIIRRVALRQLGHWMTGRARIGAKWYSISGAYGHDGLPLTVARDAWERGAPLPSELYDAWNHGGGHNSAGNEAGAMREWAQGLPGGR